MDIYEIKELHYVQEAQLDKYKQELATPNATTNVAHAAANSEGSRNDVSHFNGQN